MRKGVNEKRCKNITFSVGKFYMSTLMGLLEVLMYDIHMNTISLYYYFVLFFGLNFFWFY